MSKRLQVLLDETEFKQLRRMAREEGLTVADWVRRALKAAGRQQAHGDPERKLGVIRAAARHAFPAPDVEQMTAEIARGYVNEPQP